ncbi:MAG: ABC transporter permease [Candidatus Magasanikbacteria bacterium]|nr:ABC transporter permease [Candidatus Magasanikbacteria bacterium]
MRFSLLAKIAIKNLRVNRRRTLFTMLGLVIGITAVILVMSVGSGAQGLITNQIKARGTDLVAVLAGASEETGPPASALGILVTTLTYEDGLALMDKNNVEHGKEFAAYISGNDLVQWQSTERNITYTGTTPSYASLEKLSVREGRFFDDIEFSGYERVVVLGSLIADELFGDVDPVGASIKIKKKHFRVLGVLEEKGSDGFEDPDHAILIPLSTVQRDLLGLRHVSFLRIRVEDERFIEQTVQEIKQTLVERHGDEDFSVRKITDLLAILTTITNALKFFLVGIASVALFVGGVGVMNIMLMSVREKTREIGLRKALGARSKDIMRQFLFETIFITALAGLFGIFFGVLLAYIIARGVQYTGYDYHFIISFSSIIVTVGISLLVGLIFGLLPARKAAGLDPITALHYE